MVPLHVTSTDGRVARGRSPDRRDARRRTDPHRRARLSPGRGRAEVVVAVTAVTGPRSSRSSSVAGAVPRVAADRDPHAPRSGPRAGRGRLPRDVRGGRRSGPAGHVPRAGRARRRERRDAGDNELTAPPTPSLGDGAMKSAGGTRALGGRALPTWTGARPPQDYHARVLEALTRRRLLRAALGGLTALGVLPEAGLAKGTARPPVGARRPGRGEAPSPGDRPLFVTSRPASRAVTSRGALPSRGQAPVRLDVVRTGIGAQRRSAGRREATLSRRITRPRVAARAATLRSAHTSCASPWRRTAAAGSTGDDARATPAGRPRRSSACSASRRRSPSRSYRAEERMTLRARPTRRP